MENAVYFASVTKLVPQQISHTSLVDRRGHVIGFTPYGKEELFVADIDPADASPHQTAQAASVPRLVCRSMGLPGAAHKPGSTIGRKPPGTISSIALVMVVIPDLEPQTLKSPR